jgi:hypothetical protein
MRFGACLALMAGVLIATPARTADISDEYDVVVAFYTAVTDVCVHIARGQRLTAEVADRLNWQPVPAGAPIRSRFPKIPNWFTSKSYPDSLYLGLGDKLRDCHLILANTPFAKDGQSEMTRVLLETGFRQLNPVSLSKTMNDFRFAYELPEGVMMASLQGPYGTVDGGKDDQASFHMTLMTKDPLKLP